MARSPSAAAWVLLAAGLLSGCRGSKQAPKAELPGDGSAGAPTSGMPLDPTVARWPTWPMPNSTPGLPNPPSFDTKTAGVVVDQVTRLMWQREPNPAPLSFADAKLKCDGLSLAGFDDWRLPSRIEPVSILDVTRTEPAINVTAFPGTPNDWFWTASASAEDPQAAWYVYFYFGYPKTDTATNQFSVRCVRTAAARPEVTPHYELEADSARDTGTGLTWQRAVPAQTFVFDAARDYCSSLTLGGQQGFRVPSMAELLTLIDERAAIGPLIDTVAFPATPSEAFWTSSYFSSSPGMAWQVYFNHGNALYGLPSASFRVRCVK